MAYYLLRIDTMYVGRSVENEMVRSSRHTDHVAHMDRVRPVVNNRRQAPGLNRHTQSEQYGKILAGGCKLNMTLR